MKLFGKKKDEEIDDEEFEAEELDRKVPSRKFKDLAPQNKKKRKEPVKPWGRFERILILVILLTTVFLSIFFKLTSSGVGFTFPTLGKIDLYSLNPFKDETIIIGEEPSK